MIKLIETTASVMNLDPHLVRAFCEVESALNPLAARFEPGFNYLVTPKDWAKKMRITEATEIMLQKTSFGMMQVMGAVARELGLTDSILTLVTPEVGLKYGCLKLAQCLKKYPKQDHAIAAYNAGSPRFDKAGALVNAEYVSKIHDRYFKIAKG